MKNFMIWLLLRKYFTGDEIEENAVGVACGVCGGKEEFVQGFVGKTCGTEAAFKT